MFVANESGVNVLLLNNEKYRIGEVVRVISGPLMGIDGKIVRFGSGKSIVIEVECMGSALVSVKRSGVESVVLS